MPVKGKKNKKKQDCVKCNNLTEKGLYYPTNNFDTTEENERLKTIFNTEDVVSIR